MVVLVWMQAGPLTAQVFGVQRPPMTMTWMMFHGRGMGLCAVEWSQRDPDGTEQPVDRYAVYDWDRGQRPQGARLLHGADEVEVAGRKLCRRLGADDVRAQGRCGGPTGWAPTFSGERNLCEVEP